MSVFKKRNIANGFSLLELLLAIAIIGLIILMATRYFTTVRVNEQATDTVNMVQAIRGGIASSGYTKVSDLCKNHQIPASYCENTTSENIISPWDTGGAGTTTIAVSGGTLTITIPNVNPSDTTTATNICTKSLTDSNSCTAANGTITVVYPS